MLVSKFLLTAFTPLLLSWYSLLRECSGVRLVRGARRRLLVDLNGDKGLRGRRAAPFKSLECFRLSMRGGSSSAEDGMGAGQQHDRVMDQDEFGEVMDFDGADIQAEEEDEVYREVLEKQNDVSRGSSGSQQRRRAPQGRPNRSRARQMAGRDPSEGSAIGRAAQEQEKGALYDAYNLLHTLAQVSWLVFIARGICRPAAPN